MAINGVDDSFKTLWSSIAAGEAVTCSKTGTQFSALPPPQAVIVDASIFGCFYRCTYADDVR